MPMKTNNTPKKTYFSCFFQTADETNEITNNPNEKTTIERQLQ